MPRVVIVSIVNLTNDNVVKHGNYLTSMGDLITDLITLDHKLFELCHMKSQL